MERQQVNFTINKATDEGLEKLAQATFRSKGQVIDWLVTAKLAEMEDQLTAEKKPDGNE